MKRHAKGYYTEKDEGNDYRYNVEVRHTSEGWVWELTYTEIEKDYIFGDDKILETERINGVEDTKKEAVKAYENEVNTRSMGEDWEQQLDELYKSL